MDVGSSIPTGISILKNRHGFPDKNTVRSPQSQTHKPLDLQAWPGTRAWVRVSLLIG